MKNDEISFSDMISTEQMDGFRRNFHGNIVVRRPTVR